MRIGVSSGQGPLRGGGLEPEPAADDGAAVVRAQVVRFFEAFGDRPEHINWLVDALVARAAQRCRTREQADLAETAIAEAESDLTAWALFVLGPERVGRGSAILVARAAYRACGGADRWPGVLLRYDLPEGFIGAMREAAPPPTPPERPGRMVVQPLDNWSFRSAAAPALWNRLISVFANTSRV